MRQPLRRAAAIALACLVATGCRGVSVRKVGVRSSGAPALDTSNFGRGPLAFAAASYRDGLGAEGASGDIAARYYLRAIAQAEPEIRSSREARELSNAALKRFLRVTSGRHLRLDESWRAGLRARGIRVDFRLGGESWTPSHFDEFLFASDYRVTRLDAQIGAEGLGVPLIALKRFSLKELEGREGQEKFLMPRQVYPATAILRSVRHPADRPGSPPEFVLELHDPLRTRRAPPDASAVPIASDLTTPLAYHFVRSPLPVLQEVGLLDPQWLEKLAGLYMLHPYEPDKVPVILVHGLRSSPVAWMKVVNELRGDPALRDRYQFWLYMYPTGTPFPVSAANLRKSIGELREAVDPSHSDRALDQKVLVGHSMGGLISKMLVVDSGDALWKLIGARPFEQLRASPEHRDLLRRVFFFEAEPSVRRVVFIATPHGGSDLGDQFVGRLADRLIRLPSPLRSTYRALLAQNGADFFTPAIREGLPSSIDELRRDNPLLLTLAKLPRRPDLPIHSIIGRKDPNVPLQESGDGVVPYPSAHIDGVESELVVKGDHGCQDTPDTIRELRRILYVHLAQVDREAGAPIDPHVEVVQGCSPRIKLAPAIPSGRDDGGGWPRW